MLLSHLSDLDSLFPSLPCQSTLFILFPFSLQTHLPIFPSSHLARLSSSSLLHLSLSTCLFSISLSLSFCRFFHSSPLFWVIFSFPVETIVFNNTTENMRKREKRTLCRHREWKEKGYAADEHEDLRMQCLFLYKMERFPVDCHFHDDDDVVLISPWTCKLPFYFYRWWQRKKIYWLFSSVDTLNDKRIYRDIISHFPSNSK